MTAPAWATDLTDIQLDPAATTNWTAIGGGASGLVADTDFYVQGGATPSCMSKAAWTNAIKGMIYVPGGNFTVPTDGIMMAWGFYGASASLDTKANGGLRVIIGSSAANYYHFYVGGKDTLIFESWVPYVVDPNTATADATTGTPSGTESAIGMLADLPTTAGPTKGQPLGIDALRYGRHTLTYTFGDGSPNYNTFALAEATANSLANRWGNIEFNKGAYYVQGFHSFGSSGTVVDFRDSNKVLFIRASGGNNGTNDAVSTAYNRFEILNASSNVDWTNIIIQALGTRARGVFVHTAGTFDAVNCQFIDVDTFSLLSTSVMTTCVFRRTNTITAPGSTLTDSQILTPTVAANASAVVYDTTSDTDGKLDNMTFSKGTNAHHAITLGGTNLPNSGTVTLRGITFTGFSTSDGNNDSVILLADTGSNVSWTINAVGTTGVISVKKTRAGDSYTVVSNPVTASVHVQDINTAAAIQSAQVLMQVASTAGGWPYNAAVSTLTHSTTTATLTASAAHGLATNDYVVVTGATPALYNGVFQITVTSTTVFTYVMTSDPGSDASGTPLFTLAVISGTTDASGNISASRTYAANQPITGRVRKSTTGTLYKTSPLAGTIDSSSGLAVTSQLIPDS